MTKVAVVGAGIAGITTAYYLAKAGFNVTVFEQDRYPAMRCSYANGAQISVSNSEVWTTWANIKKGLKWMLKKDAPLLIRPSLDWDKFFWLLDFIKHTANNDYYKNTIETIRMGMQSRKLYEELLNDEHIEFDKSNSGILHFYKNQEYFQHAKNVQALYEENGCEWDIINFEKACEIDSTLQSINGVVGCAWTPSDFVGDIHKFCYNLADILRWKYNVTFVYNYKKHLTSNSYDYHIICAGINSTDFANSLGERLPVYPVKGYSITIPAKNQISLNAMPKVSLLDDEAKIVSSFLGDRLRVAGTAELTGINYDIRRDRIEPLLKWVNTNFPDVNTNEFSSFACMRPMTPNMMPITKRSDKHEKVYYNTGHGHLGWTLAPYTAKLITDTLCTISK